jgi:hypothetical protein
VIDLEPKGAHHLAEQSVPDVGPRD